MKLFVNTYLAPNGETISQSSHTNGALSHTQQSRFYDNTAETAQLWVIVPSARPFGS